MNSRAPQTDRASEPLQRLEIGDVRWRSFVAAHAGASPCHHPEWASLLADCYGLEPFVLAAVGETGALTAGLPVVAVRGRLRRRAWVSLPFTDYCPPLLGPDVPATAMATALDAARRGAGVDSLEVRGALELEPALPAVGYRHLLKLPHDPAEAFERFHHSLVRRAIRKAERDRALTIRIGASREDLCEVYYRLHLATRRRHGTPVQPRRFFRLLWERMIEPGLGSVLLAYAHGRPVAGAVLLRSDSVVLYKYAASDPAAWRLRPNHLIIWSAIQRACVDAAGLFDFGRTELEHESLRQFKLTWGSDEQPLVYTRLTSRGTAGAPIAQHTLLSAAIRHLPPLLCTVTGELLYRYAA
jgi:CelD/BcsL family acetyltransferase involved in cellulose biosynthesis